jgi:hypothetical protein
MITISILIPAASHKRCNARALRNERVPSLEPDAKPAQLSFGSCQEYCRQLQLPLKLARKLRQVGRE